jgi:hypothetical protein
LKEKLNDAVFFDGRKPYQPEVLKEKGIIYYAIGRSKAV